MKQSKRNPFRLLMLACTILCFAFQSKAQSISVSGKITDAVTAKAIEGATIASGNQKVLSAANGTYSISLANANGTLVFSSVGFTTKEISVNGKITINVSLTPVDNNLDEVVVVGYGTQRKRDITGSVGSVSAAQIKNLSLTSPEQALQGRDRKSVV